jgi:hypothetical protein
MNSEKLLKQYVGTGNKLSEKQFLELNNNLRKTYLRSILLTGPRNVTFELNYLPEEDQINVIKNRGRHIQYIRNPSEEVLLAAVKQDGEAIKFIDNPSEEVQIEAVKNYPITIEYIDNPSEKVQLAMVSDNGYAITYIKGTPSEKVQLAAVQSSPGAISTILQKNIVPSEEVQLAAVNKDPEVIKYLGYGRAEASEKVQLAAVGKRYNAFRWIQNPSEKVTQLYDQKIRELRSGKDVDENYGKINENKGTTMNSEALLRQYVDTGLPIPEHQFNGLNDNLKKTYIRKRNIALEGGFGEEDDVEKYEMPYLSDKSKIEMLKTYGHLIELIENPTEEMKLIAVEYSGDNIRYIDNPSEELQLIAVGNYLRSIRFIKNPTEKVQLKAIEFWDKNIKYIENPTEKVQLYAIEDNIDNIYLIQNPTGKVLDILKQIDGSDELNENINRIKDLLK